MARYGISGFEGRVAFTELPTVSSGAYAAVIAVDRQAMLDLLAKMKEAWRSFDISMPCGWSKTFRYTDDIPSKDLPCPCGRSDHFIIQYKELKDD